MAWCSAADRAQEKRSHVASAAVRRLAASSGSSRTAARARPGRPRRPPGPAGRRGPRSGIRRTPAGRRRPRAGPRSSPPGRPGPSPPWWRGTRARPRPRTRRAVRRRAPCRPGPRRRPGAGPGRAARPAPGPGRGGSPGTSGRRRPRAPGRGPAFLSAAIAWTKVSLPLRGSMPPTDRISGRSAAPARRRSSLAWPGSAARKRALSTPLCTTWALVPYSRRRRSRQCSLTTRIRSGSRMAWRWHSMSEGLVKSSTWWTVRSTTGAGRVAGRVPGPGRRPGLRCSPGCAGRGSRQPGGPGLRPARRRWRRPVLPGSAGAAGRG